MKYFVAIAGREFTVEVDGDRVRVAGRDALAHLSPVPGTPLSHLMFDAESLTLLVERREAGAWHLGFRGACYEARVVDERTRHIQALAGVPTSSTGPAILRAPMPGLVVRVLVSPGQVVQAGQGLVALEAMKMENELRAAAAGKVRAVAVVAGQAVEKGEVLIEFTAAE